jgi:hypothetical protein
VSFYFRPRHFIGRPPIESKEGNRGTKPITPRHPLMNFSQTRCHGGEEIIMSLE